MKALTTRVKTPQSVLWPPSASKSTKLVSREIFTKERKTKRFTIAALVLKRYFVLDIWSTELSFAPQRLPWNKIDDFLTVTQFRRIQSTLPTCARVYYCPSNGHPWAADGDQGIVFRYLGNPLDLESSPYLRHHSTPDHFTEMLPRSLTTSWIE